MQLKASNTGCIIDNTLLNHVIIESDLVAPSPSLAFSNLSLSLKYGVKHDIQCKASKNVVLVCRTKEEVFLKFPDIRFIVNIVGVSN